MKFNEVVKLIKHETINTILTSISLLWLIFNYFEENKSSIILSNEIPHIIQLRNSDTTLRSFFVYNRLIFTNNGKRKEYLLRILNPVIRARSNGIFLDKIAVDYRFYLTENTYDFFENDTANIARLKEISKEDLRIISQSIKPGNHIHKNFIVIFDTHSAYRQFIDMFVLQLKLEFSNNQTEIYERGYKVFNN
ncbi:MAG: hypothetical protein A3H98_07690 [Bacteroidetes bacterium RIFCSPLOWO2_02_FULL_36_8]|nr:MAG: hypothetical protein A3H98_07690 [Bacteroidetes bacterium RIFCSPLOWO2_02_FULL_36_8]OFY71987.1 MAG: hypothetical protein A3G23_00130 [Bacteroidetes bacterium RIFCSPLOWO2_12_FULL_37_12]